MPLLLIVALIVRVLNGAPIIFVQDRAGLGGRTFKLYKFRSMTNECDAQGRLLPDADRMTKFSRFLRATSVDELPSLINVLKGEMSLVGPRPLTSEYLPLYNPQQFRRHAVMPGLTGWAQINGRNTLSWEERFELDVWYVDHRSLRLDLRILWLTLGKVWAREGIAHAGEATMPKFTGSARCMK